MICDLPSLIISLLTYLPYPTYPTYLIYYYTYLSSIPVFLNISKDPYLFPPTLFALFCPPFLLFLFIMFELDQALELCPRSPFCEYVICRGGEAGCCLVQYLVYVDLKEGVYVCVCMCVMVGPVNSPCKIQ